MDIRATAKIKINATSEIIETLAIYRNALQFCVDYAWENRIRNKITLQYATYKHLKTTKLQAQLIVCCCRQAIEMIKKAKSKPFIKQASIRYNFPRSASFKNNILSLSTIKGRVKIPFNIPNCYKGYFSWEVAESLLKIDKKGRCFFMFIFSKDVNVKSSDVQNRVLGIDVGVNNLAVTSDKSFFGHQIKSLRIKHDKLVSALQSKGTKSAKRHLKRLSGRWKQFMQWTNHNISKRIVESVPAGTTIVMEDLTHIRELRKAKRNRWVHKWAFRQLQSFIDYKGIRAGDRIVYGNPYRTSIECPVCHDDLLRHSGFVECLHCGYSSSADLNGSRNLAIRYMRNFGLASVTTPIVSNYDTKASLDELRLSSGAINHSKAKSPHTLVVE
jgi:IS605 OrfB family transposase